MQFESFSSLDFLLELWTIQNLNLKKKLNQWTHYFFQNNIVWRCILWLNFSCCQLQCVIFCLLINHIWHNKDSYIFNIVTFKYNLKKMCLCYFLIIFFKSWTSFSILSGDLTRVRAQFIVLLRHWIQECVHFNMSYVFPHCNFGTIGRSSMVPTQKW